MPFGKYRGEFLTEIPPNYLRWLLRECDSIDSYLRRRVEEELYRRSDRDTKLQQEQPQQPPVDFKAILSRVHKEMAMRFHPDRGGHVEAMKAINCVMDRLKELTA